MTGDPDIIFWLEPLNPRAITTFSHIRNKAHFDPGYVAPNFDSRETTPATVVGEEGDIIQGQEDISSKLLFRFSQKRKDPKRGIVFGSSKTCDAFLGHAEEGISARHFKVSIDEEQRIFIESNSKTRMTVSYDGQAKDEPRQKGRWILFHGFELVVEIRGKRQRKIPNLVFSIHLPTCTSLQHETYLKTYIEETLKANDEYKRGSGELDLHLLDINTVTAGATEPASPREGPIYIKKRLVGRGLSGEVYQGVNVSTAQVYAIKDFHGDAAYMKREVEFVRSLSHDHLLKFVDFVEKVQYQWLVTEYAEGGSVEQKRRELVSHDVVMMLSQVSDGLQYLHARGIVHRDIKPANILIKSPLRPFVFVLCDFGLANYSTEADTFCGTKLYAPPELFQRSVWSPAGDVWSLGVVAYELTYGLPPMTRHKRDAWYKELMRRAERLEPDDLSDLLAHGMLRINPDDRLSASNCFKEASEIQLEASEIQQASPAPGSELTPTEVVSSSVLRREVEKALNPEASTIIVDPDDYTRRANKRSRMTAASREGRSSAGVVENIGQAQTSGDRASKSEPHIRPKRQRNNGADAANPKS